MKTQQNSSEQKMSGKEVAMTNEEKVKEIVEISQILSDFPHHRYSVEYGAIKMAEWKDRQCCANCEYLNIYNDKSLYARCTKWGWDFKPFEADTRTTKCEQFKEKKGNEI